MSVVLSDDVVGPSRRELKIEIPAPVVEAETDRVIKELRSQVQLPGFRRGKVPPKVIRSRFKENIDQEVLDRLLPRFWKQAQAEAAIDPLLAPEVSDIENEPGEPLTFRATVDVRPEIELGDIDDFDLPERDDQPTDEELEEALGDLRRQHGSWQEVDRPAARGDLIEGRVISEDEPAADEPAVDEPAADEPAEEQPEGEAADEGGEEQPAGRPAVFEVGHERVWEELTIAATGLKPGQGCDFSRRENPEDPESPDKKFRLEVDSVKERELAEANDELAEKVLGGEGGLDELKKRIGEELGRHKAAKSRQEREQALIAQLIERHPVQLPERVVEEEVRSMLEDYARELASQGLDLEQAGIDWQQLGDKVRPQAEQRVHSRLILDAIAEENLVIVPEDELERTIAMIAQQQRRPAAMVRKELDEAGKLGALRAQLRRSRTVRDLLGDEAPGAGAAEPETAPDDEPEAGPQEDRAAADDEE